MRCDGRARYAVASAVLAGVLLACGIATASADTGAGLRAFRQGDFATALGDWQDEAARGDANAALFVGALFDTGIGVRQDYGQALAWYERAAQGGSATGMLNAGVMYDQGRGIAPDRAAAAGWYERAAAAGSGRAAYDLGMMTEAGDGVPRDRVRAVQLFRTAASHGITAARQQLARLGQRYAGTVAPGLQDVAFRQFEEAQRELLTRGPGDAAHAAELFRRAAQAHNAAAEYDLAYCYEHGIGLPADQAQAGLWYKRAVADAPDDRLRTIAAAGAQGVAGRGVAPPGVARSPQQFGQARDADNAPINAR